MIVVNVVVAKRGLVALGGWKAELLHEGRMKKPNWLKLPVVITCRMQIVMMSPSLASKVMLRLDKHVTTEPCGQHNDETLHGFHW